MAPDLKAWGRCLKCVIIGVYPFIEPCGSRDFKKVFCIDEQCVVTAGV